MVRRVHVIGLVFLLFGCSDNDTTKDQGTVADLGPRFDGVPVVGDGVSRDGTTPAGQQQFTAYLSGDQMVPRNASAGSGTATVRISEDGSSIDVNLIVSNLGGLTGAEIQLGEVGRRGPTIFVLDTQAFVNPLQKTLRASDFKPAAAEKVTSFADAVKAIRGGMASIVVTTMGAPAGELRGQLGEVTLESQLNGRQLNPAGTSTATGVAKVVIAADQKSFTVTLTPKNLTGSTGAFIHAGGPGANGPVIFKVTTQALSGEITVTLKEADLTPQASQGIVTFVDAIDALLSGLTYINVNTTINPNGEIRGHIGRMVLNANLTGAAMVPPITTTANANAQLSIPNSRKEVFINLVFYDLTGVAGGDINVGELEKNGPTIFVLASGTVESPLQRTLAQQDLVLQAADGIGTFADAINAVIGGRTYVLLKTSEHPQGFLRGQIGGY